MQSYLRKNPLTFLSEDWVDFVHLFDKVAIGLVRFRIPCIIGYTITMTNVLTAVAGNTIPMKRVMKPPSIKPMIESATLRNTAPLIIVPIPVSRGAIMFSWTLLLIRRNKPKNNSAVIGLSMMLAICPPGTPVVNAETIPVVIDKIMTYFICGTNKMPKNIIDNNISGFIPNKIGGTIVCKTAPIPTNKDNITNVRVFTC